MISRHKTETLRDHELSERRCPSAAEYLGISPNTLYVWRHRRQGPPSFRMGRRVMYRITALDEWVRDQERADSRSNSALDPLNRKPQRRSKVVK
ncbi:MULTISPECIES: helix-turn-helix domain-containing protein [unclassified Streptomyces]|uniref:helix-turn-helix domain-containing protein n=1 Tax=unclassified Streptomyces TaxID=2593676 RepID=UPI000DACD898|nr:MULTISPECIES: helix-turn-helix domain-containing protein [unclassified Streptomyces]PZT76772.1 DNA-binding protein [Streptomyces sp. AC1-42W]PZT79273.1 DNA-binding protein [Streptomyces sp. AC1-42T]